MSGVVSEQIDDIRFLGGVFVDMEEGFKAADYKPDMLAFLPVLEKRHEDYFRAEASPAGDKWPVLAESTIKRKGHDAILVETGRLMQSLTGGGSDSVREVGDDGRGLLFGTEVEYSIFHDVGGGNLPKRQHVGTEEHTLQVLVDAVADRSVESLKVKT